MDHMHSERERASDDPQMERTNEVIEESEYPSSLQLTAILVSLVFSMFLVSRFILVRSPD
jgi:hypothetical protein